MITIQVSVGVVTEIGGVTESGSGDVVAAAEAVDVEASWN